MRSESELTPPTAQGCKCPQPSRHAAHSAGCTSLQIPYMLRWYAVHTKPLREIDAQLNLEHQGYEVYCPRTLHPVRRRHRAYEGVGPLFPRYLFVCVDEGIQSLRPVLRAREDPETGLHRLSDKRHLAPASRVRVVEGR
jgi:Transcription termination factor nusG